MATATSTATQVDSYSEWAQRAQTLQAVADATRDDDQCDAVMFYVFKLENAIADTPAVTLAGVIAQLRLVKRHDSMGWTSTSDRALDTALDGLAPYSAQRHIDFDGVASISPIKTAP